ncbi:class II fumarate hydratase [Desulfomarina sp.]
MASIKKNYRTETDSMGDIKVPAESLYGPQTQRAIENFTISDTPFPWSFIKGLLLIKKSAAETNADLKLLPHDLASAIVDSVDKLLSSRPQDQFPVSVFQTGSGTSTNMNVNEVICGLAARKGINLLPNDHVNFGQSSNDVIPAALHLSAAMETQDKLLPALDKLADEILQFGKANSDVIKTGRTHLMDALPIRLQAELDGWVMQLLESCERIRDSLGRLQRLPLGGTAVGSGVNCHPEFPGKVISILNEITGLSFARAPSLYKGISSLDTVVEFSGVLKATATALYKICSDLRWMNSGPDAGLSEIRLKPLQPGSSIMPAKVNPVIPEAVCMAMAKVIGNDTTIQVCGLGGNFQLNTMLPVAATTILDSIQLLSGSCLSLAEKVIPDMQVDRETCKSRLLLNPMLVTSLNPIIGYMKAAEIAKTATRDKRPVLDVAKEMTDIPETDLKRLLDPKNLADWQVEKERKRH